MKHALDTVTVDYRGQAEAHVGDAVVVLDQTGDGQNRVLVAQDGFDDAHESRGYRVVGCAFPLDDVISSVPCVEEDSFHLLDFVFAVTRRGEVAQPHACYICQRPHRHFTVAVLADDPGVDTARVDTEVSS